MFFLLFLLDDRRIRICISDYWIRMRIWEAQKNMDPMDPDPDVDPDPQHCFFGYTFLLFKFRVKITTLLIPSKYDSKLCINTSEENATSILYNYTCSIYGSPHE